MATFRMLVEDVARATTFYRDLLGFDVKEQWGPAFAMVVKDDLTLWLSGPQASAARPMPDGTQPVPGGWNRFVLQVEDLEAEVARLTGEGARFRNEIVSGPGGKQVLLEDGEGNVIELFEART